MPNFPKTEAEVISLAQSIINGMTDNPDFPSPPVTPAALQASLNTFIGSRDAQTAAYAAAERVSFEHAFYRKDIGARALATAQNRTEG